MGNVCGSWHGITDVRARLGRGAKVDQLSSYVSDFQKAFKINLNIKGGTHKYNAFQLLPTIMIWKKKKHCTRCFN